MVKNNYKEVITMDKYTERLIVYLSPKQKEKLYNDMHNIGISFPAYLRYCINNGVYVTPVTERKENNE